MNTHLDDDHALEQHLRRTLTTVAATVHDSAADAPGRRTRSRRRRRVLVGAGVAIAAVPLAAAAVVHFGPEYVDRIPPADPIISGSLDGERYWVVDGREMSGCAGSPSGIELIVEEHNVVGQEWDTAGVFFGPPTEGEGCAPPRTAVPPEYSYDADGGIRIGDGMLWFGALHPEIDEVQVALGRGEPFAAETFEHEGATYYLVEVPPGIAEFTVEYLVDGQVVQPLVGERSEHVVPTD